MQIELETGTYRRVGSNLRVVSATHRHLQRMVAEGRFREDLYYRLSTFPIHLPPLRERQGDTALLARALLERAALLCDGDAIEADHVQQALAYGLSPPPGDGWEGQARRPSRRRRLQWRARRPVPPALDDDALRRVLAAHRGSRVALAQQLGISERSLYRRLHALNMQR